MISHNFPLPNISVR